MRIIGMILCLLFIVSSCGTTFVDYDYDKNVTFQNYKTYQYDFSEATGFSTFDEQRFVKYTDSLLVSRDFERTDYNEIFIKFTVDEYETRSRNTIGVGVGGGGGNVGVGVSGGIPIGGPEIHQQIVVTIYDAAGEQNTIWEATAESDIKMKASPEKRDAHFKKVVEKIFSGYPPKE